MSLPAVAKDRALLLLQLFSATLFICLLLRFNGTGDEGDSVSHFLFAKWAFQHPANFFDHWAKPLFVLLAAPFAQFGFNGIKVFNILNFLIAQYCVFQIAKHLRFPYPIVPAILYLLAPMNIYLTLSGLTEPLFAAVLAVSILLTLKEKHVAAALLLSFLPFVRTEGLLFCGILGGYYAWSGRWKYLPLLLAGHAAYSLAGWLTGKDLLWVFTENPYAFFSSNYGSGKWDHFIVRMREITGWGIYILMLAGMLFGLTRLPKVFSERKHTPYLVELFFVYGGILVFFIFHSFAWAKGYFNSFGLLRVFVGIMPLIVLSAASGLNAFNNLLIRADRHAAFSAIVLLALLINDFVPRSDYSFNKQTHFSLRADQELHRQVAQYLDKEFPGYEKSVFYFQAPYLSETLGINIFDTAHYRSMHDYRENKPRPDGYFIVWDDWYAPVDAHVEYERIRSDTALTELKVFENKDFWNNPRRTILFKKR